jgi:hypothetical protein
MSGLGDLIQLGWIPFVGDAEKIGKAQDRGERDAHFPGESMQFATELLSIVLGIGESLAQLIAQLFDLAMGAVEVALQSLCRFGHHIY